MRPLDVGADAARVLAVPGRGRVLAVFRLALYLRLPAGLVALTSAAASHGPLHLRVDALPGVAPGDPVVVGALAMDVGGHRCCLDVPVWSPRLPQPQALGTARAAARRWLPDVRPPLGLAPDSGSGEGGGIPPGALAALRRGDLEAFAALVGGRGPGLTPAGDDVLAGVLLVARAGAFASAERLVAVADAVRTNDIARAFLACAARGRCIEPAHHLLAALADGDRARVRAAVVALQGYGGTSGAALVHGVRIGLLALGAGDSQAGGTLTRSTVAGRRDALVQCSGRSVR